MKMNRKIFFIPFLALMLLGPVACENDGTETGDPGFTLQFSSFESSQASWQQIFLPRAFAEVSQVKMCIHQIRFKADSSAEDAGENANISIGYVELNSQGTDLGEISVAAGAYRRVDVMVKDDCGEGFSLSISNDNGTYQLQQPKILRFEGAAFVVQGTEGVILQIPNFVDFFDSVSSDSDLESGVESIQGVLQ